MGVDARLHHGALVVRQLVRGGAAPVESAVGQLLAHRHARPLQGAGHRCDGQLEGVGGLRRRPAEDVAQDQHRPLPRRQVLDGDDERQLDRLPRHHRFLRVLGEHPVRVGLQVQHLGASVRQLGRHGCAVVALLQEVEAGVRRDPVQPGPQRSVAIERLPLVPRSQERLLRQVLGVFVVREHPVAVHLQRTPVALGQEREPRGVLRADRRDERGLVGARQSGVGHGHQSFHRCEGLPELTTWRRISDR